MREIKFRVWDKDLKLMHICGDDVHDSITFDGTGVAFYYNLQNGAGSYGEDSSYVLMQYTGLKDKNGYEIYEGDIVNCSSGCPHVVEWVQAYGGTYWGGMPAFYLSGLNSGYAWNEQEEVIGNIYENPELLP